MSLTPPQTVWKLQTALHAKAKAASSYRFYALYDKLYRRDVLLHAYQCCRANQGSPGVDGQSFDDIESAGLDVWLDALTQSLRDRSYRPDPVKRVWIPKPDGKERPLGIPTIRDRVVQMAAVLVMQPIFEADLPDEQFGYRPRKSALQAVETKASDVHVFRLHRYFQQLQDSHALPNMSGSNPACLAGEVNFLKPFMPEAADHPSL